MAEPASSSSKRELSPALRVPADGPLVERITTSVEETRAAVAANVNTALTLMNWHIGRMIDVEVLHEARAGYSEEIVASLEPQLTKRFGVDLTGRACIGW